MTTQDAKDGKSERFDDEVSSAGPVRTRGGTQDGNNGRPSSDIIS
jgi:hypothetical protein